MLLSEKQAIEAKLDPDAVDQQVGGRGQGPGACQWRRCFCSRHCGGHHQYRDLPA